MEYLFIYLLQVADIINTIAVSILIPSSILTLIFVVIYISEFTYCNNEDGKKFLSYIKYGAIFIISSILMFFIPTKQTMLLIGGTYLGKKAVNTVITDEKNKKD